MSAILPTASTFEAQVYGTIFAERRLAVERLEIGAALILVPDPPGVDNPAVWLHAIGGDVLGHLASDINRWLVPSMLAGNRYTAAVLSVGEQGTASWKRLTVTVCRSM